MSERFVKHCLPVFVALVLVFLMPLTALAAAETTVENEQIKVTSEDGTVETASDDASVTITVAVSKTNWGTSYTHTVSNNCGKKATVSFDYKFYNWDLTYLGSNKCSIGDTTITESNLSGTYGPVELEANATITIKTFIKCGSGGQTGTVTLSNFDIVVAQDTSKVTFDFDSAGGTVTAAGASVTDGSSVDAALDTGVALSATANSGYSFLGWIDSTGHIKSTEASFTYIPTADVTITPVFATTSGTGTGWFKCGGLYLFSNLNSAATKASGLADKTVVLMNNATLQSGDYTIPSGVRFLIPNSATDSGAFTSEPDIQLSGTIHNYPPTAFRTLIVPTGTTITCYGSINVNGHRSDNGQPFCGTVLGGYGKLVLGSESESFSDPNESDLSSQLIIGSGGTLFCYGYITGSGMVEVQNNGTLHELLQMGDWPGGTNGTSWSGNANKLFLISQYYIQNIEAPLKVSYGATANVEAVINVAVVGEVKMTAPIISKSDGLFILSNNGYLLRIYNQEADRMNYHLKGGTIDLGAVEISKSIYSISSADAIMPLTNNMSVYIEGGAVLNVDKPAAILPGAELIVDDGTLNLTSELIVYDVADWYGVKDSTQKMFFNRVAQAINEGWLPDGANENPQCNPLPYVATLDGVSPRATKFYAASNGSSYCQTDPLPITASGKLEVNGTLNINSGGYIYTTAGGTASDKVIMGTGTINYQGGIGNKSITIGTSSYETTISAGNGLGNLAGVGALQPFGNGTYYGLGENYDNYWYQYVVTVTDGETGVTADIGNGNVGETNGYKTVVHGSGNDAVTYNNVVGYVVSNGTFNFTVASQQCKTESVVASVGTLSGNYALTAVTGNSQLTITYADDHNYVNCVCTVCKWFTFYASNVRLGNNLDMMFAFPRLGLGIGTDAIPTGFKVVIQHGGNSKEIVYSADTWTLYEDPLTGQQYIYVNYDGISASQMCDIIQVTVVNPDGEVICEVWEDSIQRYAMRLLANAEAEEKTDGITDERKSKLAFLKKTVVDMLNYGSACQTYFAGQNDTTVDANYLANALLSDAQKDYGTQNLRDVSSDSYDDLQYWYGANLVPTSNIQFAVAFKNLPDGAYVKYSFTNHRGAPKEGEVRSLIDSGNGYKYFIIPLVRVADARQNIAITVCDQSGNTLEEWTESVEAYVARNQNTDAVFAAFMAFADSAWEYLHNEELSV